MPTQRENLKVEKRTVLGKAVKKLRRDHSLLPANVYGRDMKSTAIELPISAFQSVFAKTGETGLIDLQLDGEVLPVLVKSVQINPVTRQPLHADFHKVNLKEKITAMIPIVQTGEARAVTDKLGVLLQTLQEVEVEALPTDLPEKLEVSVENLAAVGDQITVADVKVPAEVTVLTEPEQVVLKIDELVSREAEEQAAAEEAAAAEAAAASEGEAEAAPAEGETPKEEAPVEAEGEKKETEPETPPEEKAA